VTNWAAYDIALRQRERPDRLVHGSSDCGVEGRAPRHARRPAALLGVGDHDRRLLERISRTTIWLDRGITRTRDEGFEAFEPWRDALIEQEASERHKLGRKIAMEEDWLR
jgi:hypothetical protein